MRDLTHLVPWLLILNIVLGMAVTVYFEQNNEAMSTFNEEISFMEENYEGFITTDYVQEQDEYGSDIRSPVDTYSAGTGTFNILLKGIALPVKNLDDYADSELEKIVLKIIKLYMWLIYIGLIAVMVIKFWWAKQSGLGS